MHTMKTEGKIAPVKSLNVASTWPKPDFELGQLVKFQDEFRELKTGYAYIRGMDFINPSSFACQCSMLHIDGDEIEDIKEQWFYQLDPLPSPQFDKLDLANLYLESFSSRRLTPV